MREAASQRRLRLFLKCRNRLCAFELGAQTLHFLPFCTARYGLSQRWALPATQQGGRQALGAGHIDLPGPSGYLAHALGFKGGRVVLAGQRRAAQRCFVGHEPWTARLAPVLFYSTTSLLHCRGLLRAGK